MCYFGFIIKLNISNLIFSIGSASFTYYKNSIICECSFLLLLEYNINPITGVSVNTSSMQLLHFYMPTYICTKVTPL